MNKLIETLSETLLWENISEYVERTVQVSEILKDMAYIEHDVFSEVKKAEIFESEQFLVESVKRRNHKYYISYTMPTILMFYDSSEQILRVTTNITGSCCIADEEHFDWDKYDFESMNRLDLLSHKDMVDVIECRYEDIDCICLECVSNGEAAKKFDGTFIQDAEEVSDKEKVDELFQCTPGYISWQGEYWLACCDDYCAYIGLVGTKELEQMGIADEVFKEYDERCEYKDVREYLEKDGSMAGYLFQCLHCGKYHLWVDAD